MSTLGDYVERVNAAAATYAVRGRRVHPLYGIHAGGCTCNRVGCERAGKHPRLKDWPTRATTDLATVERWWSWHPTGNLAIATGAGLLVLDVDPRHGGDATLADLERIHGDLPDTPRVLTGGGGLHVFLTVDGMIGNKVEVAPGLDLRGDGGFVVAPPSRHVSGRTYEWDVAAHIDETPMAPAPRWLLAMIATSARQPACSPGEEIRLVPGERNDTLFRLAAGWRRRGLGLAAIGEMLRVVNAHHVTPPLPTDELLVIAHSVVTRYAPGSTDADAADDTLLAQCFGATVA